jgi:2-hydroxy-3-keto-5-methylthiopentenyl-1-phosphate phosphatase
LQVSSINDGKLNPNNKNKLLFQSDFDGTITVEDISFIILDKYARGDWRRILQDYKSGQIKVGEFNRRAFALVSEDQETLEKYVLANYQLRPGFKTLLSYCSKNGIRFVITSNGLDFYIRAILKHVNIDSLEVYSARTVFGNEHLETEYLSPDGNAIDDGFKEAYSRHFIENGYDIIYAGNGASDAPAASLAKHVFATESLVDVLEKAKKPFSPFKDLNEVANNIKKVIGN